MSFRRWFLLALIGFTLVFSYSSYADIKDVYTGAPNIDAAIEKAKKENKKVLVYLTAKRDSVLSYDYDRILFTYPDFIEILKNYVLVRDWATTQYAKSKKASVIKEVVGETRLLYFALIDPADISKITHVSILPTEQSMYISEGNIVRELIKFAKGEAEAEKYTPSETKAEKLNQIKSIYSDIFPRFESIPEFQVLDKIKEMESLIPGTLMAGILKNSFDRKKDQGKRIEACTINQTSLDKVVICFDEFTYLREIGKWSRERFYPVLYWHPYLTMNFIREFEPMEIELIPPEPKEDVDEKTVFNAILASFSDKEIDDFKKSSAEDLKKLYVEKNHKPRGVVLLNLKAPEYLGGVALAVARAQWVEMFDSGSNQQTRTDFAGVEQIRKKLMDQLDKSGFEYKGWSDIDYITMAANIPYNYNYGIAGNGGNYVIDDAIARLDNDLRYAFVGRLMYGAGVATYQAMCSLFLKPSDTLLFSKYGNEGIWKQYWPDEVESELKADAYYHPKATLARFDAIMQSGNKYNFVYINSSGGAKKWSTSSDSGTHENIPFSVPCVVHMTHSGTFGAPFDVDSIAVRWILGGAYCYLGSHSEPFLDAFVMPNVSIDHASDGIPLGEAFRWVAPEQRWRPWKLAYVGDPMYTISDGDPDRTEPGEIDRKHTFPNVFKEFTKYMKKAKKEDRAKVYSQVFGLALMKEKASDVKKFLKSIYKKKLDGDVLNSVLTEFLGFMLHNLDEEKVELIELFEFIEFPEKLDKMNNWMFDRLFVRMYPFLMEVEVSKIYKFVEILSELKIPEIQLTYVVRMLKSLVEDEDFIEEIEMPKEKFIEKLLGEMKKKSKLLELTKQSLVK